MCVTLLGTGDTTETPTVGYDCEACLTARERGIERTRFSAHMQNGRTGESLFVDFSPDFHHQFLTQDVPLPGGALVTHIHSDHLGGLSNVYRLLDDLLVHVADEVDPVMSESAADVIHSKLDYLDRISVEDWTSFESFRACGLGVTFMPIIHPPLVCYGVAIEDPETGAKLSLSGGTTCVIPEMSRDALHDLDLLLAKAIIPVSVCEHYPIGGDDYDGDGVARTLSTKHVIREGTIAPGGELNTDGTRLIHVVHYYPTDEAFEKPLTVDGEVYNL